MTEAALDDRLWKEVMEDLRVELSGSHGIIFTPDVDPTSAGGIWSSPTISPTDVSEYLQYYHAKDLWTVRGLETGMIKTGRIFVGQEVVSDQDFVESEFYQDFMRLLDAKNLLTATVFDGTSDVPRVMMSIFAGNQSDPFAKDAVEFYRSIISGVQNSIALRQRFKTFEDKSLSFEFLFNSIQTPSLLVDDSRRVIAINAAAEGLLTSTDDFFVRSKLACWCPNDQRKLDAAFHRVSEVGTVERERSAVVTVKSKYSTTPYVIDFRTVPGSRDVFGRTPCAMICISSTRPTNMEHISAVCDFYGLTKAEKALCLRLLNGHSLIASAELLGITEGTARQRLKTVFSKTGTRSQVALNSLFRSF
ncbi:hypothetical protein KAJ83_05815 [Marivibrio halodurans]|uniref:HTH luxR-type domain-containing protein n=1 Tax=Marivibrio halodurans TaxID=2039722 RepID=A0A8J7S0M0_9PROT|nr:hypothetical protein [Marivibrio halodurans]MBP5856514.1 hypothetical protein [Marivibrio halodurans]